MKPPRRPHQTVKQFDASSTPIKLNNSLISCGSLKAGTGSLLGCLGAGGSVFHYSARSENPFSVFPLVRKMSFPFFRSFENSVSHFSARSEKQLSIGQLVWKIAFLFVPLVRKISFPIFRSFGKSVSHLSNRSEIPFSVFSDRSDNKKSIYPLGETQNPCPIVRKTRFPRFRAPRQ